MLYFSCNQLIEIRRAHRVGVFIPDDHTNEETWVPSENPDPEEELLASASRLRYRHQIPGGREEFRRFGSNLRNLACRSDRISKLVGTILALFPSATRSGRTYGPEPTAVDSSRICTVENPTSFNDRMNDVYPDYSPPSFPATNRKKKRRVRGECLRTGSRILCILLIYNILIFTHINLLSTYIQIQPSPLRRDGCTRSVERSGTADPRRG